MALIEDEVLTLYQRALGLQFEGLPSVLREFHGNLHGGNAAGLLEITRGDGTLRNVIADLLRLPRAGSRVPARVEVRVQDKSELWIRRFGNRTLITHQFLDNGLLVERAGLLRLWFAVSADKVGMRFNTERCSLVGVRMPNHMAFRVTANIIGTANGWWVNVEVLAPAFGSLVRYEGEVVPN